MSDEQPIFDVRELSVHYGRTRALQEVSFKLPAQQITSIIGPSGCGKTTLLRSFNRLNDLIDGVRTEGEILFEGQSIFDTRMEVSLLRRRVGMVFQRSNPFPKSIFENVAYGPRVHGVTKRWELEAIVERSLRGAALWDEVKDQLSTSALSLASGQQQRLCIARALAVEPEVILLDEPCSSLDPKATARIEDLMLELRDNYTLILVTHSLQQASRVSDYTAFLYLGELVEFGSTERIFINPLRKETEDYITGRFA